MATFLTRTNRDVDREILLNVPYDRLRAVCLTDQYSSSLCDPTFWRRKFERDYTDIGVSQRTFDYRKLLNELKGKSSNDLLIYAAEEGYLALVKYSLDNGADVHANYDEALRLAASNGHLDVVKVLIEEGANIHVYNDYALRLAADNGHLGVVKVLIEAGADIHAVNDDALRWAAANGQLDVIKVLVEAGAGISVVKNSRLPADVMKYLLSRDRKIEVPKSPRGGPTQCAGTTKAGDRCKKTCPKGETYCHLHR